MTQPLGFRGRRPPHRFPNRVDAAMHRDWSINLGKVGTAPSMYPAKFSFNPHATPSCANDFVVFPVNAVGSATLCSPYVAYGDDLACLGNDIGVLYRIKNVLCTTTACATDPVGSEYAPGVMVIDNSSASAQASSIYFNALNEDAACSSPQTGANTGGCAVKLTQAGLR